MIILKKIITFFEIRFKVNISWFFKIGFIICAGVITFSAWDPDPQYPDYNIRIRNIRISNIRIRNIRIIISGL